MPEQMVIFLKPNSSMSKYLYANQDQPLHYEGEICFMVKKGKLYAVGFGLDLTKRALQSQLKAKGLPWDRAKAFDGAACFSEFILLADLDIATLSLQLDINGNTVQSGGYALMIYKPQQILREISSFMTLEDGDIIMTGTPKGVGAVVAGDRFNGRILSGNHLLVSQEWTAK